MSDEEQRKIKKKFVFALKEGRARIAKDNTNLMNLLDLCEDMAAYTKHTNECPVNQITECTCGLDNVLNRYNLLSVLKNKD